MTATEMNCAIAEWVGRSWPVNKDGWFCWHDAKGNLLKYLPNYHGSLDVVAKAEARLPPEMQEEYQDMLYDVCNPTIGPDDGWKVTTASAAQRAEALLRVLGLWRETKKDKPE